MLEKKYDKLLHKLIKQTKDHNLRTIPISDIDYQYRSIDIEKTMKTKKFITTN